MTDFTIWLLTQHGRKDDVGAIAKFAAKSSEFPRHRRKLHFFLAWAGEDPRLRRAIKHAHEEWRGRRAAHRNNNQQEVCE